MIKPVDEIRRILYADDFVSKRQADDERRSQQGIAVIAISAFLVMSVLNIIQRSYIMLATTGTSALMLGVGCYISAKYKKPAFLRWVFCTIFVALFTGYTIRGGNEGFAALWLIVATYSVMLAIDFKTGFIISTYYFIMLLLVFLGPLKGVLMYDYNKTFMLRFPFLFVINFAFATYVAVKIRMYQYELLKKQDQLEHMSLIDLSTGLMNRNCFIRDEKDFDTAKLDSLCAIFIDVNGLHEVNNLYGHAVGDEMLYDIAMLCQRHFPNDSIYRMGGDEFLVVIRNGDYHRAEGAAIEMTDEVNAKGYSISYGISLQRGNYDIPALVKEADGKMVENKKAYYRRRT